MKNFITLFSVLAFAACGGSKPAPVSVEPPPVEEAPPPVMEEPVPAAEAAPEVTPPPPPAPKVTKAKAELSPNKGQKFQPGVVMFSQTEGDATSQVSSPEGFAGLKAGSYHLVVHTAADCGPNATKAGAPFPGAEAPIAFTAEADSSAIDVPSAPLQLEGEKTVTGRVLVLHSDKRGKAGKALACGPITADE